MDIDELELAITVTTLNKFHCYIHYTRNHLLMQDKVYPLQKLNYSHCGLMDRLQE